MPEIHVEFFGIPRHRAGVAEAVVHVGSPSVSLQELLHLLADRFPTLAEDCLDAGRLAASCTANVNGEQFLREPQARLHDGDRLLLMSADAGG